MIKSDGHEYADTTYSFRYSGKELAEKIYPHA